MGKLLWKPSAERIEKANMTKFIDFVNKKYSLKISSYFQLYNWSIENIPDFWAAMWEFGKVICSRKYEKVVDDLNKFPGAKWFVGARLNFAENLLRYRDNHTAFIFKGENGKTAKITYAELYNKVARLAKSLREIGVAPGDRVVAYMPNLIETATAMLAATSVGAVWASCGAELGASAVLDRLGQIAPKVLFTADGYWYKGKTFSIMANVEKIAKQISSLEKVVVASFTEDKPDISSIPHSAYYEDFLSKEKRPEIRFEQLPSDHPLYIMFSSGTTGKPKCMVQGAGGILINHLKELMLHTDLKREDIIMYITSCSWMMWNWLLSSLAVGATIVLYDGNPCYPDADAMWRLVQDEQITIFGCSASYINFLRSQNVQPCKNYDLSSLREISQTGSPLSAEGFEYVYEAIKKDLHFNSIAGGTDINGCFTAGSPTLPVYAGELQAPALGMKIKAYDEKGYAVVDKQGELVCEAPAPSMPLYFWNDPNNEKYLDAYFRFYPNKNVWRHGDFILIHSDTGGVTHCGRSDAVLKPSGVRIGTAEIYNIVEKLPEIADSLAVGQEWKGDQRIILFVKIAPGYSLTEALKDKIRKNLRENASPRHVPALIIEAPDIPYTFNMKKVEIAVWNIIHGKPVINREALVNPESLDYFEKILPELHKE
ncbi:MAG: acetoacetate--CoA ligase [Candidatus Bathyarchaeia archaeon]